MRMSSYVSEMMQENSIVTRQEVKDESEVALRDVVATSRSVSKEALTLGDIISMEDSQRPPNNSNTHGPEENIDRETEQEITEEPIDGSLRHYLSSEMAELESQRLNDVIEVSCDHNLFSRRSARMIYSGPTSVSGFRSARMIYSEPTLVSGFRSVRSDGSSVSASSFAFPILQSERNSSPVRMVKAEKTQRRKEKGRRHYPLLLCCRF